MPLRPVRAPAGVSPYTTDEAAYFWCRVAFILEFLIWGLKILLKSLELLLLVCDIV
jgi:hypothetical protein